MSTPRKTTISAAGLVRQFSHFSDMALARPVVVTKNGRPRNVLLSFEEYERLKSRDQQAFMAAATPERFLSDLRKLAKGDR